MTEATVPKPVVLALVLLGLAFAEPRIVARWPHIIDVVVVVPPTPPAPITVPGFRALMLEESESRGGLTLEQQRILMSTSGGTVRDYLLTHVAKAENGNPDFRFLDKDDNLSLESPVMKQYFEQAIKDSSGKLPWIVAGDGKKWLSKPIDSSLTAEKLIAELKKVGGD